MYNVPLFGQEFKTNLMDVLARQLSNDSMVHLRFSTYQYELNITYAVNIVYILNVCFMSI